MPGAPPRVGGPVLPPNASPASAQGLLALFKPLAPSAAAAAARRGNSIARQFVSKRSNLGDVVVPEASEAHIKAEQARTFALSVLGQDYSRNGGKT